ncbi:(2Fe-2S)-binding protein [Saccharopolyspora flava]|uniref:2Fe-2S iron-sulfur cluster binding domain-containing protein n=1 Tax=Saccharopolyspora flava TaxID=95161 RepID=A0A1I6U2U0_9PSEU|nr:(2Fe-2S)-binding protein [Saccharopolyspora flava]SFS95786.1 2Fe-2S iron-sulfur cluster binding domain-containing protein [Saccharopolyspora flava]
MTGPYLLPAHLDPARPRHRTGFAVEVDGRRVAARAGQTVAAVLMSLGVTSWRGPDRRRGLFCGIGVCSECLLVVNGTPDVRACLREVEPGDVISTREPGTR